MEAIIERCAGLDVHQATVVAIPSQAMPGLPRHLNGEITMPEMIIFNNDRWGRAYNLGKDRPIGAPALAR